MAFHLVRPGAAAAAADDAGDHLRRLAVHHWRCRRQPRQGPAGDGVQLAHVAPGKRPQERPQGGRRPDPAEHLCHGAVPQDVQVIDVVRPGGHARDQQGIFRPGFTPAGLAIVTCSPARSARPHRWAGAMTGTRPARDTLAGQLPRRGNVLSFSLAGDGEIDLLLVAKKPGPALDLDVARGRPGSARFHDSVVQT
jgi:hypothetical protein